MMDEQVWETISGDDARDLVSSMFGEIEDRWPGWRHDVLIVRGNLQVQGHLFADYDYSDGIRCGLSDTDCFGASYRAESGDTVCPGDLDLAAHAYMLLVTGDLQVEGGILNSDGDCGCDVLVGGEARAQWLIAGGGVFAFNRAVISDSVVGHYNHGTVYIRDLVAQYLVSEDHDLQVLRCEVEGYYEDFGWIGVDRSIGESSDDVLHRVHDRATSYLASLKMRFR